MSKKRPWPDVPRLLQMRQKVGDIQPGIATSLTAFLAWKAFLITAKSVGTGSERERCVERLAEAQKQEAGCRIPAARFADALEVLVEQSNVAIAEWLAADDDDEATRDEKVATFKRKIQRLTPRAKNSGLALSDRWTIAEHAISLRNSIIAHGSVHSTGNLFQFVVPRFESFIAASACQGYAAKAGLTYEEALNECAVGIT